MNDAARTRIFAFMGALRTHGWEVRYLGAEQSEMVHAKRDGYTLSMSVYDTGRAFMKLVSPERVAVDGLDHDDMRWLAGLSAEQLGREIVRRTEAQGE